MFISIPKGNKTMTQFQVIRTDYPMEVHAVGCRDLARKGHDLDWKITGETVADAVVKESAAMNADFDRVYDASELFRIMPCCK